MIRHHALHRPSRFRRVRRFQRQNLRASEEKSPFEIKKLDCDQQRILHAIMTHVQFSGVKKAKGAELYCGLIEAIRSGRIRPGDELPRAADLATYLGNVVERVIRKVYNQLHEIGILGNSLLGRQSVLVDHASDLVQTSILSSEILREIFDRTPLHNETLVRYIKTLITAVADGMIRTGDRIPGEGATAKALGKDPSTIARVVRPFREQGFFVQNNITHYTITRTDFEKLLPKIVKKSPAEFANLIGDPALHRPMYVWLAKRIRALIVSGKIQSSETLPGLKATSEALGITTRPLYDAYQILEKEGTLVKASPKYFQAK